MNDLTMEEIRTLHELVRTAFRLAGSSFSDRQRQVLESAATKLETTILAE